MLHERAGLRMVRFFHFGDANSRLFNLPLS
ncbi:MAG: hypothetical protein RL459_1853 [Pseudomonadota bacterium]|jgi:hypothetical protein